VQCVKLSAWRCARLLVDHLPTSHREYRPSFFTFGYMRRSGCFCLKDSVLLIPQLCCGRSINMELSISIAARSFTDTDIFLQPTGHSSSAEHTPHQQHVARDCHLLLQRANLTIHVYIISCAKYSYVLFGEENLYQKKNLRKKA